MPAPLPPYAMPILAAAARLSYSTAQHILDAVSIAALLICAANLGKITRSGTMVALLALAPIAWYVVVLGQPLLLVLAALVASAVMLKREQDGWAAAYASLMMFEPHVGVAVCASLFLWRPKARLVFLIVALVLVLVSMTVLPSSLTVEYFTSVLPLHALSEATSPLQYSSTALLSALGASVRLALTLGSFQYLLTLAFGIVVTSWAATRLRDISALVFVPSLFAVLGGTYIHYTDFLLAIPAALLLLVQSRYGAIVAVATAALSPHANVILGLPGLLLGTMCAGGMLLYLHHRALAISCIVGLGAVAAIAAVSPEPKPLHAHIAAVPPTAYAEQSWTEYIRTNQTSTSSLIGRAPEWLGLIVLCSFAVGQRRTVATAITGG